MKLVVIALVAGAAVLGAPAVTASADTCRISGFDSNGYPYSATVPCSSVPPKADPTKSAACAKAVKAAFWNKDANGAPCGRHGCTVTMRYVSGGSRVKNFAKVCGNHRATVTLSNGSKITGNSTRGSSGGVMTDNGAGSVSVTVSY